MPETPISPAKVTVSVTQVILGWFSAHSCTVDSKVHKSQEKKKNHLKIEIFKISARKWKQEASCRESVYPWLFLSQLWRYELCWNTRRDTALGRPAAEIKYKELITFGRTLAVARRAMKAQSPLSSITVPSNKQTAVAPYPLKHRVLKGRKVHLLVVRRLALIWVFPHNCNKCWEDLNTEDAARGRRYRWCSH